MKLNIPIIVENNTERNGITEGSRLTGFGRWLWSVTESLNSCIYSRHNSRNCRETSPDASLSSQCKQFLHSKVKKNGLHSKAKLGCIIHLFNKTAWNVAYIFTFNISKSLPSVSQKKKKKLNLTDFLCLFIFRPIQKFICSTSWIWD